MRGYALLQEDFLTLPESIGCTSEKERVKKHQNFGFKCVFSSFFANILPRLCLGSFRFPSQAPKSPRFQGCRKICRPSGKRPSIPITLEQR